MNTPNALLMDIGNVLLKVDPVGIFSYLQEKGVAPIDEAKSRVLHQIAIKYEQGMISTDTFLEEVGALLGIPYPEERETIQNAWEAVFPENAAISVTIDVCRNLKEKGIRLVLFSNTNELHTRYMDKHYPELRKIFDEAIYSHIVEAEKPAPPMYLTARDDLGLIPEKTLYFDDRPENIHAGREFGFQAHVFDYEKPETFLSHLPDSWKN